MKNFFLGILIILISLSSNAFGQESNRSLLEKILNRDLPGGPAYPKQKKNSNTDDQKIISSDIDAECKNIDDTSLLEKVFRRDLPGGSGKKAKCIKSKRQAKLKKNNLKNNNNNDTHNISFYTGTFDVIDKEGDDQTTLIGIEHKDEDLFRNTLLGKFKPITGGFMTGDNSVYLYTGVEGQYGIGPLKILPSFAPGYYEKGDGKDLGSVLEFKSEIKVGFDIFENSKLSYSYSHISNNDWGDTNPGTDNQQITFSKNF